VNAVPYVHMIEGRLRIKVPEVKGAPERARVIESQIRMIDGVDEVVANPITGSVLIHYDARRTLMADITETLQTWGYLRHAVPATHAPAGAGRGWGDMMLRATTEFALQQLLGALV
jgi:copper chaperone CopZ